jgi:hypothetical protein
MPVSPSFLRSLQSGQPIVSDPETIERRERNARGFSSMPSAVSNYFGNSTLGSLGRDAWGLAKGVGQYAREEPAEFIAGFNPIAGAGLAARDSAQLEKAIEAALLAGDYESADRLGRYNAMSMAGSIPIAGGLFRALRKGGARNVAKSAGNSGLLDVVSDNTLRLQRAKDMGFDIDNRVYHGTYAKVLEEFDDALIGKRDEGFFGRGHYFTDNYGEASWYGPNVGEYVTRGNLLDLSPTKANSNFELGDKKYFKFWTKELDKLDMLDEPTKRGLKTINKIDDYVDNNVKFIKSTDNRGNDGISAYVKDPTKTDDLDRIYSHSVNSAAFGLTDKEIATKSLKNKIIDELPYNSRLRKLYPDTENILYSLSDYIRVGGKGAAELTKQAKKSGYDGIKVGDETVIFEPKNIRSIDAEFNKNNTESSRLMSSVQANNGLLGRLS